MGNFCKGLIKLIKMKKIILGQGGIGDVIIFISYVYDHLPKDEKFCINIHPDILTMFDDPDGYFEFLKKLVNFLSPDDRVFIEKNTDAELIDITGIFQIYRNNFWPFFYINSKNKFDQEKDDSAIVLNTKIRPLSIDGFNAISSDFFKILNNSPKKIILIGEKEIQYGKLYGENSKNFVYSAYPSFIKNLDPSKIIDLSMPSFGRGSLDFENLMKDMQIMNKYKNICFGTSGAFSITSCVGEVISYAPVHDPLTSILNGKKNIYSNNELFFENLLNYIK